MKRTPKGFAQLALLLLLVVIAVAVYAGYKEVKNHQQATTASQTGAAATKSVSDNIKSPADLDKATADLNSQNIDGDLNPDGFNSDVSSLQ